MDLELVFKERYHQHCSWTNEQDSVLLPDNGGGGNQVLLAGLNLSHFGLDNRWKGFEPTTLCQGWTDLAAEAKWNNSSDQALKHGQELTLRQQAISFQCQRGTQTAGSSTGLTCTRLHTAPVARQRACFWNALFLPGYCSTMARSQIPWRTVSCNECTIKSSNLLKLPGRLMWGLPSSLYLAFLICGSTYLCLR